ncbi:MAG: hypothetical protein JKY37_20650 [Nannocystaceae bacterium]|nr:hypothetical protein [Nannocystaceae bacterium]
MSRWLRLGRAAALALGCGPGTSAVDGGFGGSDSGGSDPASTGGGHDTVGGETPSTEDCLAAGGNYRELNPPEVLPGPTFRPELPTGDPSGFFRVLGVQTRDDGHWLAISVDPPGADHDLVFGVELSLDGEPLAPAVRLDDAWAYGRVWPGSNGAVVTYVEQEQARWSFIDRHGTQIAVGGSEAKDPRVLRTPSAAWVTPDTALIAWIETGVSCNGGQSCIFVARAGRDSSAPSRAIASGGAWGHGPGVSVIVGADSGMVAMLRVDDSFDEALHIVAIPIDLHGSPTAAPTVVEVPPSSGGTPVSRSNDAQLWYDNDGGFVVYLGGFGPSLGVLRLDRDGGVVAPLQELSTSVAAGVSAVYSHDMWPAVSVSADVHIVTGRAVWGGALWSLATAIDTQGRPLGDTLRFAHSLVPSSHGGRTWLFGDYLGGGLQVTELGCVP